MSKQIPPTIYTKLINGYERVKNYSHLRLITCSSDNILDHQLSKRHSNHYNYKNLSNLVKVSLEPHHNPVNTLSAEYLSAEYFQVSVVMIDEFQIYNSRWILYRAHFKNFPTNTLIFWRINVYTKIKYYTQNGHFC